MSHPPSASRRTTRTPLSSSPVWAPHEQQLLDCLADHLGDHISADDRRSSSSTCCALTLPAAAVSWLNRVLLFSEEAENEDDTTTTSTTMHDHSVDHRPTFFLQLLLHRATHVRITTEPWPSVQPEHQSRTLLFRPQLTRRRRRRNHEAAPELSSSSEMDRGPPRIDLALFPGLRVLWLDRVPVDWLRPASTTTTTTTGRRRLLLPRRLQVLRVEHSCLDNLPQQLVTIFGGGMDSLTHVKLSHCRLGEQSGLRGVRQPKHRKKMAGTTAPALEDDNIQTCLPPDENEDDSDERKPAAVSTDDSSLPPMARLSRSIQSLCLSHNELQSDKTALAGLDHLTALVKLDLSHNWLRNGLPRAHLYLGNVETLILSHNQMETVAGIDRLVSLRTLYLDHNQLQDLHLVASRLAALPLLTTLRLEGNPLQYLSSNHNVPTVNGRSNTEHRSKFQLAQLYKKYRKNPDYRLTVLNAFRERRFASCETSELATLTLRTVQVMLPTLDDEPATLAELQDLRRRTFVPVLVPAVHAVAAAARQFGSGGDAATMVSLTIKNTTDGMNQNHTAAMVPEHTLRSCAYASGRVHRLKRRRRYANLTPVLDHDGAMIFSVKSLPTTTPAVAFNVQDVVNSMELQPQPTSNVDVGPLESPKQPENWSGGTRVECDSLDFLDENIGEKYIAMVVRKRQMVVERKRTDQHDSVSMPQVSTIANLDADVSNPFEKESAKTFSGTYSPPSPLQGHNTPEKSVADDYLLAKKVQDAIDDGADDAGIATLLLSRMQNHKQDTPDMKASLDSTAATTTDTHTVSGTNTPLRAVSPVVETPHSATPLRSPLKHAALSNGSVASGTSAYNTPQASPLHKLNIRITSFSDNHWRDDAMSIASSNETPIRATDSVKSLSRAEAFRLAERNSTYTGPNSFRRLFIRENLELYFRLFVFSAGSFSKLPIEINEGDEAWLAILQQYPRIQLWPIDRSKREQAYKRQLLLNIGNFLDVSADPKTVEEFRRVWCEKVVACGKRALQRLTPCRDARFGFHGELLWSEAESSHMKPDAVVEPRSTICCLSDRAFYIVSDHDAVTAKARETKKTFPLPIPKDAQFSAAKWPHAMAWHSLDTLRRITIGFGFQRLTLTFVEDPVSSTSLSVSPNPPGSNCFTYILLTANKMETVALLKELQDLTREISETVICSPNLSTSPSLQIDNDDPHVLDALSRAVEPDALGVVLHYQILQQRWKRGDRGTVRRVCVVTDSNLFLLDEDYAGDGSDVVEGDCAMAKSLGASELDAIGASVNRLVDSALLSQVVEVQAASADPKAITIVIKSSRLKKAHNWRLLCRDGQGAERLVEDVRKALSMVTL